MGAADLFLTSVGRRPDGLWAAPGRVTVIGEHTDHSDGFVLPIALAQRVVVAAGRRGDGQLVARSAQQPHEPYARALEQLAPGAAAGWSGYVAGVAWALREAGHDIGGVDIVVDSDVPVGAGLSSSAALECATALALNDLFGLGLGRMELAHLGRQAENEFVGVPCGILDQSASLLATERHALLLDTRSLAYEQIPFDPAAAGLALLLIDTRSRHALVDGRYAARQDACRRAAQVLGVPALRDATLDGVLRLGDPLLRRRARHVVTENARVTEAAGLLRRGAVHRIGPLLTASHASLRDDFEVTVPELDVAVEVALASGAHGARMVGGGFGGCVLVLVDAQAAPSVAAAVAAAFARRGFRRPLPLHAVPSGGAARIR
ncbi:galactokinase [Parafrankia colletiae]|uniref:Galactokinase n=1 Tax=Parafrankia colletiae TaxID=573497 RepID=A0A1S1QL58_9ACTN|nr:galactokinase [Parafrankia colletiae]MCK9903445.1 galactokinase [Frankia sp. Cpl3]OHV35493.1 galactokinase [Parafrankia colletiae]